MKVLFHTTFASPTARANPGQVIDLPEAEATQIIAGGYGSAVDDPEPRRRRSPEDLSRGTVDEVIARVDDDSELAGQALEAESAKRNPRKTLVAALAEIIATGADSEEE